MADAMQWNSDDFELANSPALVAMCKAKADEIANRWRTAADAHVEQGHYRDSIHVERAARPGRPVFLVVADDWKALLIESRYGLGARSIKG